MNAHLSRYQHYGARCLTFVAARMTFLVCPCGPATRTLAMLLLLVLLQTDAGAQVHSYHSRVNHSSAVAAEHYKHSPHLRLQTEPPGDAAPLPALAAELSHTGSPFLGLRDEVPGNGFELRLPGSAEASARVQTGRLITLSIAADASASVANPLVTSAAAAAVGIPPSPPPPAAAEGPQWNHLIGRLELNSAEPSSRSSSRALRMGSDASGSSRGRALQRSDSSTAAASRAPSSLFPSPSSLKPRWVVAKKGVGYFRRVQVCNRSTFSGCRCIIGAR